MFFRDSNPLFEDALTLDDPLSPLTSTHTTKDDTHTHPNSTYTPPPHQDRNTVSIWSSFWTNHTLLGGIFTGILIITLWFTFPQCPVCVLSIFCVSSCCCIRFPILQLVFWPALIIILLNTHLLRQMHVTVDVPVGNVIDNVWQTSSPTTPTNAQGRQSTSVLQSTLSSLQLPSVDAPPPHTIPDTALDLSLIHI